MKRKIILIIISLINLLFLKTQPLHADNLKSKTQKIDKQIELLNSYISNNPEILRSELDKTILKAKRLNYKKGLSELYKIYADYYYDLEKLNEAQQYYLKSIELKKAIKDYDSLFYLFNALGNVYSFKSDLNSALKYYLEAINYHKNNSQLATTQNNIAKIYISLKDYNEALKYLKKALKNCDDKQLNIKQIIYTNIGIIYHNKGKLDFAKEYYLKSITLNELLNNANGLSRNYNNLGNLYSKLKKYDKALKYYKESLDIKEKSGDKSSIIYPLINIANLYQDQKRSEKALKYYKKALSISKSNNEKESAKILYLNLSDIYKERKDYKNAYKYYMKYSTLADSLEKIANKKDIENIKLKYENEKKEKELKNYKLQVYKQKFIKTRLYFGIILFFLLSLFIYFHYNHIKRLNINLTKQIKKNKLIQAELSNAKKELEEKVKIRTNELSIKNKELLKEILEKEKNFEILRRYAFIVNNAKDLIILINKDYNIEIINDSCIKEAHLKKKNIIDSKFEKLWDKELYDKIIYKNIKKAFEGEEVHFQANFSIVKEKKRFYDVAYYPYKDKKGNVIYVVSLSRDISKYKKVEQQLAQSEKLAALGEMAAGMAHEIKNPVTIIKSTSQLLKENYKNYSNEKIEKMMDIFVETSERINDIVDELRDYIKPKIYTFSKENLVSIINNTVLFTKEKCKSKNIYISFKHLEENISLEIDQAQMHKVFLNLILNAINAIEKNGKILLELSQNNNEVIFGISDNGKGIYPNQMKKIFNPFYTTRERGMGLGLGIVYQILKRHKAEIEVESTPDIGTTFTIVFKRNWNV